MSFKDRFLEFAIPRTVGFLIGIPILLLAIMGDHLLGKDGICTFVRYVYLPFTAIVFGCLLRFAWLRRQRRLRGARWKQRIQQIADNIDPSFDDGMFVHFCEFTDEYELERTLDLLKQMPKGQRNVNEAYDKVLESDG
jgi:hypothetical protein